MKRTDLDVTVVICAYTEDRWTELVAAVASIQAQTVPPREIIVACDHNPSLLLRVNQYLPGVIGVENKEQRGLSGARNSGIAAARGEVIAFLDEDAIAAPDWLARLLAEYNDPQVLGVGGAIVPMWLASRPRWFPEEFDWVVGCTYKGMPDAAKPVRNLIGCNMSFRREAFDTVGGFHNGIGRVGTIPVGCEETEFCIRVSQHHPKKILLYNPEARVHHRVPAKRSNWNYFHSRCYAEGRSKALVSRLVGAKDGLASERTYTRRTLPQGIRRGLADTVFHRDMAGLGRAGALMAGLMITTAGYVTGKISEWRTIRAQANTSTGMVRPSPGL